MSVHWEGGKHQNSKKQPQDFKQERSRRSTSRSSLIFCLHVQYRDESQDGSLQPGGVRPHSAAAPSPVVAHSALRVHLWVSQGCIPGLAKRQKGQLALAKGHQRQDSDEEIQWQACMNEGMVISDAAIAVCQDIGP